MDKQTEKNIFNALDKLKDHKAEWHLLAHPRAGSGTLCMYVPYTRNQVSKVVRKYESILTFRLSEQAYRPRFYNFS